MKLEELWRWVMSIYNVTTEEFVKSPVSEEVRNRPFAM